jgi:hypothetical protein
MIVYGSTNKKLKKDMEIAGGIEVSEEYYSEDLSIRIRNKIQRKICETRNFERYLCCTWS